MTTTIRSFGTPLLAFALSAAWIGCDDSVDSADCPDAASVEACVVPLDPCPDRNPLRNAYVGELHAHTAYSFDSILAGVAADPRTRYQVVGE